MNESKIKILEYLIVRNELELLELYDGNILQCNVPSHHCRIECDLYKLCMDTYDGFEAVFDVSEDHIKENYPEYSI